MRVVQSAGLSFHLKSSLISQFVDIASVLNACLPSNHVLYAGKDSHQVDRQSRITLSCLLYFHFDCRYILDFLNKRHERVILDWRST